MPDFSCPLPWSALTAPFGPGSPALLLVPDRWIASVMAAALGAILSTTASAPTETRVADFTRELRIVLRLTENLPRETWEMATPYTRASSALTKRRPSTAPLFTSGDEVNRNETPT
ncbi:hypothetical protein [Streptomyces sp. NPDC059224]|uniref:hypothetical protein n=1 Tax=Streptomyces sp. NPDC059224 TaxID=3346775 RepID=UPI0036A7E985